MGTVSDLLEGYLDSLESRPSAIRYRHVYGRYVKPRWGALDATALSTKQLILFKQEHERDRREQVRKAIGLVRQGYRWARTTVNPVTEEFYFDGPNPVTDIILSRGDSRERLASHDELKLIVKELPYLHPTHAAFFAVRLTAPCRIKELCETGPSSWQRRSVGAIWTKAVTKNGKEHKVYVAPQALQFLDALPWSGQYFFTGAHGHHLTEGAIGKAWRQFMADLHIQDLQLLDIRRTLASYLYKLHKRSEADDLTIKALLNHYDPRPVAIYTRLNVEDLVPILQGYADWLWGLTTTH